MRRISFFGYVFEATTEGRTRRCGISEKREQDPPSAVRRGERANEGAATVARCRLRRLARVLSRTTCTFVTARATQNGEVYLLFTRAEYNEIDEREKERA